MIIFEMSKKKMIIKMSDEILREKYKEWLTDRKVLNYIKKIIPKNDIEKKILQRMACIVGGSMKLKKKLFINEKLTNLLISFKK